jgi:hypothetical protein
MKKIFQEVKDSIMLEISVQKLIMLIDITQWKKKVLFLILINELIYSLFQAFFYFFFLIFIYFYLFLYILALK